jgi:hypothetical protein
MKYILGRNWTTHKQHIRFNKEEWASALHKLGKGHQCGPMEQIMEMIEYEYEGKWLCLSIQIA